MIKGVSLGVSIAIFLTSLAVIVAGFSGALQSSFITGAAIGAAGVVSYGVVFLIVSMIAIFLLTLSMRPKRRY